LYVALVKQNWLSLSLELLLLLEWSLDDKSPWYLSANVVVPVVVDVAFDPLVVVAVVGVSNDDDDIDKRLSYYYH
jgi:hypothetical protein